MLISHLFCLLIFFLILITANFLFGTLFRNLFLYISQLISIYFATYFYIFPPLIYVYIFHLQSLTFSLLFLFLFFFYILTFPLRILIPCQLKCQTIIMFSLYLFETFFFYALYLSHSCHLLSQVCFLYVVLFVWLKHVFKIFHLFHFFYLLSLLTSVYFVLLLISLFKYHTIFYLLHIDLHSDVTHFFLYESL